MLRGILSNGTQLLIGVDNFLTVYFEVYYHLYNLVHFQGLLTGYMLGFLELRSSRTKGIFRDLWSAKLDNKRGNYCLERQMDLKKSQDVSLWLFEKNWLEPHISITQMPSSNNTLRTLIERSKSNLKQHKINP